MITKTVRIVQKNQTAYLEGRKVSYKVPVTLLKVSWKLFGVLPLYTKYTILNHPEYKKIILN